MGAPIIIKGKIKGVMNNKNLTGLAKDIGISIGHLKTLRAEAMARYLCDQEIMDYIVFQAKNPKRKSGSDKVFAMAARSEAKALSKTAAGYYAFNLKRGKDYVEALCSQ